MNTENSFIEALAMGPLVCDGAMSTMLYSNLGVSLDRPPEELCLTNPDQVRDVHLSYIRSGAQIIETNTFAANKEKLSYWLKLLIG